MTTTPPKSRARRERRIIERPRLTKLLDESEARIILLLAPAGYGKTTLARQWAKTLSSVIWITCTPAHRDVVAFAEDVAKGVDELGGDVSRAIRAHVSGQLNPQRAVRQIAAPLVEGLIRARVQWVIIDDYQEIFESTGAEELVELMQREVGDARFLIASRIRPTWVKSKSIIYGDAIEIGRDALAMTLDESSDLLGRRAGLQLLVEQADGWPAVLSLASGVRNPSPPTGVLASGLHRYFAEELFQTAPAELRQQLIALALLPTLDTAAIETHLNVDGADLVEQAKQLGFLNGDEPLYVHPLLREFLFERLLESPDAAQQVRDAVTHCVESQQWSAALELITRFNCDDLIEPVLQLAFRPLLRGGRVETLSRFASQVRLGPTFPPPSVDVVDAEMALRDGQLELAELLAERVGQRLGSHHPLRPRASIIAGQSCLLQVSYAKAAKAFQDASETATDTRDEGEAINGLALAKIFGEEDDAGQAVARLYERRHISPFDLVRAVTAELVRRRLHEGVAAPLQIDEAIHALPQVEDPRARSAFAYNVAYTLALRARYEEANRWIERLIKDVTDHGLEFARPHAIWTSAFVRLGLRRFGETERQLQALEDIIGEDDFGGHALNARILRARLLLQSGKPDEAAGITAEPPSSRVPRSWHGEYLSTHALALACANEAESIVHARAAEGLSRGVETRVMAAAARAVFESASGGAHHAHDLFQLAARLGVWDPVVCALRASESFADQVAHDAATRSAVERLYGMSGDAGLARRAQFRTRVTRRPSEILTSREEEVLGLIAQGMRNKEIAKALFISESTAKVHVRHLLEKLGVRSRAQAVSRYEMFASEPRTNPDSNS